MKPPASNSTIITSDSVAMDQSKSNIGSTENPEEKWSKTLEDFSQGEEQELVENPSMERIRNRELALQQFETKLREQFKEVAKQKNDLDRQKREFDQSKDIAITSLCLKDVLQQSMNLLQQIHQQKNKTFECSSDVVELNVGGVLFTTTKSTLCFVPPDENPNHLLAKLFDSNRSSLRDNHGRIVIDRNAVVFEYILNYLRNGGNIDYSGIPFHDITTVNTLLVECDYFGLLKMKHLIKREKCSLPLEEAKEVLETEEEKQEDQDLGIVMRTILALFRFLYLVVFAVLISVLLFMLWDYFSMFIDATTLSISNRNSQKIN